MKQFVLVPFIVGLVCMLGASVVFARVEIAAKLDIVAKHELAGKMRIKIEALNVRDIVMWTREIEGWRDEFDTQSIHPPKTARTLRLTYVKDEGDGTAFIDYIMVNTIRYEAEDFVGAGGCDVETIGGKTVAVCADAGDFLEFELHQGNPEGPPKGPGVRVGPTP